MLLLLFAGAFDLELEIDIEFGFLLFGDDFHLFPGAKQGLLVFHLYAPFALHGGPE